MKWGKKALVGVLVLSLVANGVLGWRLLAKDSSAAASQAVPSQYDLLSQRTLLENPRDIIISFTRLRAALRDYVGKSTDQVALYFEYLPSGSSVGVNADQEEELSSLAKVPTVMAVYHEIEKGSLHEDAKITLTKDMLNDQSGDWYKKGVGAVVSLDEAVQATIKQSDNTAALALVSVLPESAMYDVFDHLDLPEKLDGPYPILSPKAYTSILRSLFLASYVDNDHSSRILNYMTQTTFNDTLQGGVPTGVKVAHKVGIHDQPNGTSNYSDCGIIYLPKRPYALCIMTKGATETNAKQLIRDISHMVYTYVSTVNEK